MTKFELDTFANYTDSELLVLIESGKCPTPFIWYHLRRNKYKIWSGSIKKPVEVNYKISLCVHCMNRIQEAIITIPVNIRSNLDYPNFELVLLDYNSSDGLNKWVKTNLIRYIDRGILSYYRTEEPEYFKLSHSKNIVMKLAKGDIVNAIDIDMLCGKGFASHINLLANQFSPGEHIVFAKRYKLNSRVGFWKKDFLDLGGYDESLKGYGWEDRDLFFRALESGFALALYDDLKFYGYVGGVFYRHRPIDRYKNYHPNERCRPISNKINSYKRILKGDYIANKDTHWGKANLTKNFSEAVTI